MRSSTRSSSRRKKVVYTPKKKRRFCAPETLLWLFPAVFVLHEAEEILFLPPWLQRHRGVALESFSARFFPPASVFDGISRTTFAGIAAEEFVLVLLGHGMGVMGGCLLSVAGAVPRRLACTLSFICCRGS